MQPTYFVCINVEVGKESNCLFVTPTNSTGSLDCCRRSDSLEQRQIVEKCKKRAFVSRCSQLSERLKQRTGARNSYVFRSFEAFV